MKLKLKFDKDAILLFCLDHVEKFAFGAVVFVFLMMIMSAWNWKRSVAMDPTRSSPGQLEDASETARQHWEETEPVVPSECQAPDYFETVEITLRTVKDDFYGHSVPWNQWIFDTPGPRGDPPKYTVEKLRGVAGRAAFQLKQRGSSTGVRVGRSSESIRGQRWIVLTALVPIEKQIETYEEFFKNVQKRDPRRDVPKYIYYRVERAEVTSPQDADDTDWKPFSRRRELERAAARWSNELPEIVDQKYLGDPGSDGKPVLVFPLGPRVRQAEVAGNRLAMAPRGRNTAEDSPWDDSVAHPPEIPVMTNEESESPEEPGPDYRITPEEPGEDVPDLVDDPLALDRGPRTTPVAAVRTRDRFPSPRPIGATPVGPGSDEDDSPEYWLFRFFDYTVEPGDRYRYRVRLLLANPNEGISPRYLLNPELGKLRWLQSEWSEPSEVISVPRDTELLAVSVKPPLRKGTEPSARMRIFKWVEECGKEAQTEKLLVRGQVANFPGCTYPEIRERPKEDDEDDFLTTRPRAETPETFDVDYLTEALVVDINGGQRLPGNDRLSAPGEILLLDPDGSLVVHNELEDTAKYDARTETAEPESDDGASGPISSGGSSRVPGLELSD